MKSQIKYSLLLTGLLLWSGCRQSSTSSTAGGYEVFNAGKMRVITTALNPQLHSMAILYGNTLAYDTALKGNGHHTVGEKYTYVTWKYRESPRWFGSDINEDLIAVETLQVTKDKEGYLRFDYTVEKGTPLPVDGRQLQTKDRIAYLLEYRPAVIP
ncbi:hypothetical protein [Sinomicrobium sp. M5D2P17]